MIDTHVHFWQYNKVKDAWITDDMKILQKDFLPPDFVPVLKENNIEGVIAVQADQSENENEFLMGLSEANPFIKGIVGWVDFPNKNIENRLLYYSKFSVVKGFRHIVQAEPAGFLKNKDFLEGVGLLRKYNFTYDVLIYENQLQEAIEFVKKFPDQKFMIDHFAKPNVKQKSIDTWKKAIEKIARYENVYCKLSGLTTEAEWTTWEEQDFYPYFDYVLNAFGTNRLVFGSDWPVVTISGGYSRWKQLVENFVRDFSKEDKEKIFTKNAMEFYNVHED
ncbi:MAG: amidohydrolase family protein [Ginsengibacter sp.]